MSNFFLLEKNESYNNLFRRVLQLRGHNVVGCMDDYNEFLSIMDDNNNGNTPDYLIIDNNVVSDNFVQVSNQLLGKNPKLKIIFINTNGTTPIERHYDTGAVMFVKEKFSIRSLYNSIDKLDNM